MNFNKRNEFFAGIDSDGTVFDTMKIKHTFTFIPTAIEVFGLEEYKDKFIKIAEKINLYSLTRGINRFPGLLLTFDELKKSVGFDNYDANAFNAYINSGYPFSNNGLENYIAENPSPFLEKVLMWSRSSDILFEKNCENIKPFDAVTETIKHIKSRSDIMVVSAASGKGLETDWTNAGLKNYVDFIAGQELGSKSEQLSYAANMGYNTKNMLMIGDALGDYNSAKSVGAMFYPIIPGSENECWKLLNEKYIDMFFENRYDEKVENELYDKFIAFLKGESK